MLKIKEEVDINNPIVIFVPKNKGRRLTFNYSKVDEKDYPKYKLMGFNIFRCSECGTDTCFGDCSEPITKVTKTEEVVELKVAKVEKEVAKVVTEKTKFKVVTPEPLIINGKLFCLSCEKLITDKKKKVYCSEKCKKDYKNKDKK